MRRTFLPVFLYFCTSALAPEVPPISIDLVLSSI